jgi:hypothetical protein
MQSHKITWVKPLSEGMEEPFLLGNWDRPWYKSFYYWCLRTPSNIWYYRIRPFFQRLFNHGIADMDLWNLNDTLTVYIYPRLKAFIERDRAGYPSVFGEYYEGGPYTKEEYDAKIASGELKSGAEEAWNKVLYEMLYAFEYDFYGCDLYIGQPKQKEFFKKYFGELPDDPKEENITRTYHYYMHKPGPDLAPWMTCGEELSEERCKPSEAELYIIEEQYFNWELERKAGERAREGMKLFAEYYGSLWD